MGLKLSIIIPALNEAASIEQTVRHALALKAYEVVVVDGGSTDGTPQIVERAGCHLISTARGRALQQNAGASTATGDVLLFLHADCWLEPAAYQQIEQALCSADVVGGAFRHCIAAQGLVYRLLEAGNARRVAWLQTPYGDQGIFLRRDVFEQLGSFPNVRLMEDLLLMRAVRKLGRIVLLPGPLHVSARRWQKHGPIRQTLRNWCLLSAERCGVHPNRLADFYAPHWKPSER